MKANYSLSIEHFKSHFDLKKNTLVFHDTNRKSEVSSFMSGMTDAIDLIKDLYESGRLDLEFKPGVVVRFNEIGDYARECRISDEIALDEFEYTLLDRYYYSAVKQIFDLLNRDFYFKLSM